MSDWFHNILFIFDRVVIMKSGPDEVFLGKYMTYFYMVYYCSTVDNIWVCHASNNNNTDERRPQIRGTPAKKRMKNGI